ncbi:MAG TPA: hypothetical protein P5234_02895 [Thermoanaerobaculaceae bacterium]|nr:hypothetical protein [Thermoanaerobaculaceae bacterium]HRS15176.1 hypothetical protein [Thermoanaerobaculaceae bacterium]
MRALGRTALALVLAVLAAGCYQPRKEKPHERITRLRLQYKIEANWYENRTGADDQPALFMSLSGRNLGREGLAQLTMIMHIRHFDGTSRLRQPLTLDVSSIPPQAPKPTRLEVLVPGVEVHEGEELALQLEDQPHQDVMPTYPEYAGATSWAPAAAATRTVAR